MKLRVFRHGLPLPRFQLYGLASALFTACTCLLASLPVVLKRGRGKEEEGRGPVDANDPLGMVNDGRPLYYPVLRSTLDIRARVSASARRRSLSQLVPGDSGGPIRTGGLSPRLAFFSSFTPVSRDSRGKPRRNFILSRAISPAIN